MPFLDQGDLNDRLQLKERVVALTIGSASAAHPFRHLAEMRVVNDRLDDQNIVILYAPGARSALDEREVATSKVVGQAGVFPGTSGSHLLTFEAANDGHFTDVETGSTRDVTGKALTGSLAGQTLEVLPHTVVSGAWRVMTGTSVIRYRCETAASRRTANCSISRATKAVQPV